MDNNWGNPFNHSQVHPQQVGDMQLYMDMIRQGPSVLPHPGLSGGFASTGEGSNPPQDPPPPLDPAPRTTRRKQAVGKQKLSNFMMSEDNTLVSCWLNASLDPIAANGQRKASFWKNLQKETNFPDRTQRSIEGRWSDIKEKVAKFEAYFNKVVMENGSGYVDSDKG